MNPNKLIYGVGLNDSKETVSHKINGKRRNKPQYNVWHDMLRRCYSIESLNNRATYKGCTVCDGWLVFSGFKLWMDSQESNGMHLDKDLLVFGSTIYSPETCLFIPSKINSLLTDVKTTTSKYPKGVSKHASGKYVAQISEYGKRRHIGLFNLVDDAKSAYNNARFNYLISLATTEKNPIISAAIVNRAASELTFTGSK